MSEEPVTQPAPEVKRVTFDVDSEEAATMVAVLAYAAEELLTLCAVVHASGDKEVAYTMSSVVTFLSTVCSAKTHEQGVDFVEDVKRKLASLQKFQEYGASILAKNLDSLTPALFSGGKPGTRH